MGEERRNERDWYEFTQETTMHGIKYTKTRELPTLRRAIWTFFIVICVGYFIYATALFLLAYSKKLVNTRIRVKNAANLTFPTVTICNRNYWRRSVSTANFSTETVATFSKVLLDMYSLTAELPPPEGKYNWSDPHLAAILKLTTDNIEGLLKATSHPLEDTFKLCMVQRVVIPCKEIFVQVKTDAGYCYQFNSNGSLVTNSAGLNGGVQFNLDVASDEYYIGPFSYSEGFSIALHDKDTVPLVSEISYGVSPGTETNVVVQKREIVRQPPPADDGEADCFDTHKKANPLHYFNNYTFSGCYEECKASFVINKCGCRDLLQQALNNSRPCNAYESLYCSLPALREFYRKLEYLDACNCKSVCAEVEYTAKLSAYKFPNHQYANDANYTEVEYNRMLKNQVIVSVFYGQMSYEKLWEEFAFTPQDLIANLGGTLGVCIGASLLTLVEFIEFAILALVRFLLRKPSFRQEKTAIQSLKVEKNQISPSANNLQRASWEEVYP